MLITEKNQENSYRLVLHEKSLQSAIKSKWFYQHLKKKENLQSRARWEFLLILFCFLNVLVCFTEIMSNGKNDF